jgi:GNAT superfamily N-acetyltransferase
MFAQLIASGCVFVAERDGEVIGGIAGYLEQTWYGTNFVATELAHFIKPEHRGSAVPMRLVNTFIKWGKSRGAAEIHIGIISGVQQERTEQLYERLGGIRIGSLFKFGGV